MSHDINVNEETGKASVFVVKDPAWHGLGQVVENALNAEQAIEAAGLDWDVVKIPHNYEFNGQVMVLILEQSVKITLQYRIVKHLLFLTIWLMKRKRFIILLVL